MANFNHTWIICWRSWEAIWPTLSDCHFFNFIALAFSWRPQGTNKKSKSQPTDLRSIPLFPILGIYPYPVFLKKRYSSSQENLGSGRKEIRATGREVPKWSCWSTSMSVEGRGNNDLYAEYSLQKMSKLFDDSKSHSWTQAGFKEWVLQRYAKCCLQKLKNSYIIHSYIFITL